MSLILNMKVASQDSLSNYERLHLLGKGSFGVVYKVRDKRSKLA